MNLKSTDTIAGINAKEARDACRMLQQMPGPNSRAWLSDCLRERDCSSPEQVIDALIEGDLVTLDDTGLRLTALGVQLASHRFISRITRAKADALVAGLLDRARAINADRTLAYDVAAIYAFGSYTDKSKADVGDVDLIVDLEPREKDGHKQVELNKTRAKQSGKKVDWVVQLFYGKKEVLEKLRYGRRHLAFADRSSVVEYGAKLVLLFSATAATEAPGGHAESQ